MNWPEMAEAVKFMRGGDVGFCFAIEPGLEEDQVWHKTVLPLLTGLPANVLDIWQYCVTEMVNNAIDHSNGSGETLAPIPISVASKGLCEAVSISNGSSRERNAAGARWAGEATGATA
jgi:hypothetical protein